MNTCMCGNPIDTIGTMCSRCGALQTLGLEMNATAGQVEDTWRTLIKVWHPDRFQSDPKLRRAAEEKVKEVNAAHDYLTGEPASAPPRPPVAEPEPSQEPEEYRPASPFVSRQVTEEPEEVRRVMSRLRRRSHLKTSINLMVAFCAIAVIGLLAFAVDFFLSANATTARPWEELKAELSRDVHANGLRLWSNATGNMHGSKTENEQPLQQAAPAATVAPAPAKAESSPSRHSANASKPMTGAKPYVTSGLTPMEVISILGSPTSSAGEKIFYKGSEIDFRNGQVVGWKIDSRTAAIRVKLWPETPPGQGVTTFSAGSSKSDVIALQGTPNLFSDNEFGYGSSMVFFKNDRVVGWKENPASVRLRVVAH